MSDLWQKIIIGVASASITALLSIVIFIIKRRHDLHMYERKFDDEKLQRLKKSYADWASAYQELQGLLRKVAKLDDVDASEEVIKPIAKCLADEQRRLLVFEENDEFAARVHDVCDLSYLLEIQSDYNAALNYVDKDVPIEQLPQQQYDRIENIAQKLSKAIEEKQIAVKRLLDDVRKRSTL